MTIGAETSPFLHHLVEGEAEAVALAEADPADARRQALEGDALARHVEPAVEVRIVGDQLLHPLVGLVDVLGIARQRGPAERADAAAEERADVGGDEAGEVEGVGDAVVKGFLADVVAIVEGRNAHGLEGEHGLDVAGHGVAGGFGDGSGIALAHLLPFGDAPAGRAIAVGGVMGAEVWSVTASGRMPRATISGRISAALPSRPTLVGSVALAMISSASSMLVARWST